VSGVFQRRRGVRAGLPDLMVLDRRKTVFIEMKSKRDTASKVQKQIRSELLRVGSARWMARSARAAMIGLHLSGVVFRRKWKRPRLKPWEGPFDDPTQRLPQHPVVPPRDEPQDGNVESVIAVVTLSQPHTLNNCRIPMPRLLITLSQLPSTCPPQK
jgi:hypothetical protein